MKRTMRVRRRALLERARGLLENVTPLPEDCGTLCGGACCKGDGAMWLFPGEDAFYEAADWTPLHPGLEAVEAQGNLGVPFLRCTLTDCPRTLRPLSCRIFPCFPMAVRDGRTGKLRVRAILDPRAVRVCPLLRENAPAVTAEFRHRVEQVGRLLLQEPSLREYLLKTGADLLEMGRLL